MLKHNYLQKDYTTNGIEKQLKIPFVIELKIEKSDPVMLLSQYVEEMDLTDLYSTYERIRENQATPRQNMAIEKQDELRRMIDNAFIAFKISLKDVRANIESLVRIMQADNDCISFLKDYQSEEYIEWTKKSGIRVTEGEISDNLAQIKRF